MKTNEEIEKIIGLINECVYLNGVSKLKINNGN